MNSGLIQSDTELQVAPGICVYYYTLRPFRTYIYTLAITQEFLHCPLDGEVAQVGVVLADTDKEDGDIGGVDERDKSADHVANCIALGNDETIEGADGAEGSVEVAGLGDRICPDEGL